MTFFRQTNRLTLLLNPVKKSMPFQPLWFSPEFLSPILLKFKTLQYYSNYLSSLLQRADRGDLKPSYFLGVQILFSLIASVFFGFLSESVELALLAFMGGGTLPLLWIRDQALKREKTLLKELPNALEILSLCSEAGLSLEQSMDQYLAHSKLGPLSNEFSIILEQTKSGSNRKMALEASSTRLNLTDFTLFTTSLIQAERFGTGISKTLRQLSLTLRDKQSQRAEKAVQEMPVKMLLPLILFIMPVTFLIIFGPILMQFFHP